MKIIDAFFDKVVTLGMAIFFASLLIKDILAGLFHKEQPQIPQDDALNQAGMRPTFEGRR